MPNIEDQVQALEAAAIREEVAGLLTKHGIPVPFQAVVAHRIGSQVKRDATGNLVFGTSPLHEGFQEWLSTPEGEEFRKFPGADG